MLQLYTTEFMNQSFTL